MRKCDAADHCCRQYTRPYVQLHGASVLQVAEIENAWVMIALSVLASMGFQSLHVEVPNEDGPGAPVHTPQPPRWVPFAITLMGARKLPAPKSDAVVATTTPSTRTHGAPPKSNRDMADACFVARNAL